MLYRRRRRGRNPVVQEVIQSADQLPPSAPAAEVRAPTCRPGRGTRCTAFVMDLYARRSGADELADQAIADRGRKRGIGAGNSPTPIGGSLPQCVLLINGPGRDPGPRVGQRPGGEEPDHYGKEDLGPGLARDDERGGHSGEGLIALPQHCKHSRRLAPPPGGGARPVMRSPPLRETETPPAHRGSPIGIHFEAGPGRPWWWS